MKTKILIVDDHRVVIEGIKSALRVYPELAVVNEAHNGLDAVRMVRRIKPDIVVMDISMPDLNGIDATLQIRKYCPNVKIIIFTMYPDSEYIVDLFRAGISAYILKEDPMSELLNAINTVRNGGTYFSHMVQKVMLNHLRGREAGRENPKDSFEELSLREREVFQLLAEGKSIKEIAGKLNVSPKTVESHKYHIMGKLKIDSIADLTRIAIKRKLIQP